MKTVWIRGAWVLLALVLSSFCFLYGALHKVPGSVYTGLRGINVSDLNVHMSFIEQCREGKFLLKNLYTAEPHEGVSVRPGYFLLSLPFALTNLSNPAVYHIQRVFCGLLLLVSLFLFLKTFAANERVVNIAFLLLVFSSGAGFLVHRWIPDSVDISVPESWLFASLGEGPHFLLSLTILWLGIISFYRAQSGSMRALAITLCSLTFLWWDHPFDAVILLAVCGANLWVLPSHRLRFAFVGIAGVLSLPAFLYYQYLKAQPSFAGWGSAQNLMLSPSLPAVLSGLAFLFLMAIAGAVLLWKDAPNRRAFAFLLAWIVAQIIAMYLPFPFQRRLMAGIQFPLALLAAHFLSRIRWNTVVAVIIVAISAGSFVMMRGQVYDIRSNGMPFYLPLAYKQAFEWMRQQPAKGSVLSGFVTGNFIPAYTGFQSYVGHSSLTPDVFEKRKLLEAFYRNPDLAFVRQNNFQFIFWGAEEFHTAPGQRLQNRFPVAYSGKGIWILKP